MAKSKLVVMNEDLSINESFNTAVVPKIKGVQPCGSQVLIEMLTVQELAGTSLAISDKTDLKVPMQGYVRAVGPAFKPNDWGFNVGDRVLVSGSGVLSPNYDNCHRDRFFMEPHAIRSVLTEE